MGLQPTSSAVVAQSPQSQRGSGPWSCTQRRDLRLRERLGTVLVILGRDYVRDGGEQADEVVGGEYGEIN